MKHPRLPYRDDSFDEGDTAPATAALIAAAQARVDEADEAYRRAVYWMRTAKPHNREIRWKHLQRCTRFALEAAAALEAARAAT